MDMTLEIELGVTGGEEDGVDNTDIDSSKLYTQPEEVAYAFEELSQDQQINSPLLQHLEMCMGCTNLETSNLTPKDFKEFSRICL